jgi:enterobactin synthetase component D / holo-[acyl-carrier protein] synthase
MNLSNPARLSSRYQLLFPPGVIAAESDQPGRVELLLPQEAACLGRSVPERQQEFAAGRLCARRALTELAIEDFAVIAAPDRQPVWPAAIVGSITHTVGLCAAVVARRSQFAGLGVDTEIVGRVSAQLRPRICIAAELDWIDSLPEAQRAGAAALVFAAKEAFYKCQSPMTREWLGFMDVRIETAADTFQVIPTRSIALAELRTPPFAGRYRFHQEFVSAGVALEA